MLSLLILAIACLPQFISSSNLALTFDATNSTCTATCTTCSDNSNTDTNQYNTEDGLIGELLNTTRSKDQDIQEIKQKMDGIISSLSHIKETATSNAGAINDILLLVEDLIMLHNDSSSSSFSPIPTSCEEIKNKQPNSPSGVYLLETATNGTQYVYCNMEELCGSGGGWTRLAYLDMTDSTENCPFRFRLYQSGGVRACGRATSSVGSCVSVQFPSNGISYSQVCGRVVGYQYTSPDAVDPTLLGHNDINSYYVDGVSITHGSPRQHVWTLMAGLLDANDIRHNCPCSQGSPQNSTLQSFIGNDYFCETGNPSGTWQYNKLYTSDPLWDGKGCGGSEDICCTSRPSLPWFNKVLNTTTTDYLELRVCGDQDTTDEDVPVSFYELYVK